MTGIWWQCQNNPSRPADSGCRFYPIIFIISPNTKHFNLITLSRDLIWAEASEQERHVCKNKLIAIAPDHHTQRAAEAPLWSLLNNKMLIKYFWSGLGLSPVRCKNIHQIDMMGGLINKQILYQVSPSGICSIIKLVGDRCVTRSVRCHHLVVAAFPTPLLPWVLLKNCHHCQALVPLIQKFKPKSRGLGKREDTKIHWAILPPVTHHSIR